MAKRKVDVFLNTVGKGFSKGMAGAGRSVSTFSGKLGKLGKGLAKLSAVGLAGIVAGAGAAGAALFRLGESFAAQTDKIRVGTGATGAALEDLEDSFKDVLKSVPASFDDAGTAVADLNTRLGITGDQLEERSAQFINLSRITKTDLAGNIEGITRVFGDWGIATEDQAESMDKLFRASQFGGIGIDQLSAQIVQFGAPLRNLGFGFEEAAALLTQFEKTGVNTETVMAGLKSGVGKLAKEGEDVPTTFARVVKEIEALGPSSESTAKAIELFGQRSGPDLADAIAGGKFQLEEFLDAIENGDDTINAAAKDTERFGEKWTKIKNRVLVGIEPLATAVFDAMGDAMDRLEPHIDTLTGWLEENIPAAIATATEIWDEWAPAVATTISQIVAGISTVVGAVRRVIDAFRNLGSGEGSQEASKLAGIFAQVRTLVSSAVDTIVAVANRLAEIWGVIGPTITKHVRNAFDSVLEILRGALNVITGFVELVGAIFRGDWAAAWEAVKKIVDGAWDAIFGIVRQALRTLGTIFALALQGLRVQFGGFWSGAVDEVTGVWDRITGIVRSGWDLITGIFAGGRSLAGAAFRGIYEGAIGWVNTLITNVRSAVDSIVRFFTSIPDRVGGALRSVPGFGAVASLVERASGGITQRGELTLVGERGPEIAAFPTGTNIIPNGEVRRLASATSPAAAGGISIQVPVAGSVLTERALMDVVSDAVNRGLKGAA